MQDQHAKLQDLRTRILNDLTAMSDQLAEGDQLDAESLLALAEATGSVEVYEKALGKVEALPEPSQKIDGLLSLLGNVEGLLADNPEKSGTEE